MFSRRKRESWKTMTKIWLLMPTKILMMRQSCSLMSLWSRRTPMRWKTKQMTTKNCAKVTKEKPLKTCWITSCRMNNSPSTRCINSTSLCNINSSSRSWRPTPEICISTCTICSNINSPSNTTLWRLDCLQLTKQCFKVLLKLNKTRNLNRIRKRRSSLCHSYLPQRLSKCNIRCLWVFPCRFSHQALLWWTFPSQWWRPSHRYLLCLRNLLRFRTMVISKPLQKWISVSCSKCKTAVQAYPRIAMICSSRASSPTTSNIRFPPCHSSIISKGIKFLLASLSPHEKTQFKGSSTSLILIIRTWRIRLLSLILALQGHSLIQGLQVDQDPSPNNIHSRIKLNFKTVHLETVKFRPGKKWTLDSTV